MGAEKISLSNWFQVSDLVKEVLTTSVSGVLAGYIFWELLPVTTAREKQYTFQSIALLTKK